MPNPPGLPKAMVELTQYTLPYGEAKTVTCEVPEEIAAIAEGMALSCEILRTGHVAIYARYEDEDEEAELMELASNDPGAALEKHPDVRLTALIQRVALRRKVAANG